jgi:hypothetical protein
LTVIKLESRVIDRIARELSPVLADRGIVTANVAEIENVERWRKASRRAGRQLGYPVRTAVSTDGTMVWAVVERRVQSGEQAEAANQVTTLIFGPRPFVRCYGPDD